MLRDERGVVLVLALPWTVVLVFALWHLARIGQVVLEREQLQDAVDAAAFESAALHARGMNALALLATLQPASKAQRAVVRELSQKVASVVPVLATVAAVEDNEAFYGHKLMVASQALLPSDLDGELVTDRERPWAFERGASARRLGEGSSLPVQRDGERLRMWPQAENGNAMLQVWSWSQPLRGEPALAQAEFYFACRGEWSACEPHALGSRDWTARLRRLWSPVDMLKLRARDPVQDALKRTDERLRPLLPNALRAQDLLLMFAGPTPHWMH
ncbi:MAG: pilus assembly protein TadG-related protein [Polyangiales bacterium]